MFRWSTTIEGLVFGLRTMPCIRRMRFSWSKCCHLSKGRVIWLDLNALGGFVNGYHPIPK